MWKAPRTRVAGESWWTHARGVIGGAVTNARSEHHEMREGGKVAAGAGFGGVLGWIATMASVTGSGAHYKVWTVWSILLVTLSAAALLGGVFCWWFFRKPTGPQKTVIHAAPGSTINVYGEAGVVNTTTNASASGHLEFSGQAEGQVIPLEEPPATP